MGAEGTLPSSDGTQLYWRSWIPKMAPTHTLAVLHGHGEHSGRYEGLAKALGQEAIAVVAVDWRGHGKAGGQRGHALSWDELIADATAFYDFVRTMAAPDEEVIPLGHSVGGAILASGIIRGRLKPRRFVLSSPALRIKAQVPGWKIGMGKAMSRLVPTFSLDSELALDGLSHDPAVAPAYRADPLTHGKISARFYTQWLAANAETLERAAEVKIPFLASHGSADPIIDPAATEEFFNRTGSTAKVLKIYDGYLHEPYNETGREAVFADLARWIKEGKTA